MNFNSYSEDLNIGKYINQYQHVSVFGYDFIIKWAKWNLKIILKWYQNNVRYNQYILFKVEYNYRQYNYTIFAEDSKF